jgi:microcystin degradation protein MlrC
VLKCGYLAPTMKPLANPHLMALSPGAIDQDILHLANKRRGPRFPGSPICPMCRSLIFRPVDRPDAASVQEMIGRLPFSSDIVAG